MHAFHSGTSIKLHLCPSATFEPRQSCVRPRSGRKARNSDRVLVPRPLWRSSSPHWACMFRDNCQVSQGGLWGPGAAAGRKHDTCIPHPSMPSMAPSRWPHNSPTSMQEVLRHTGHPSPHPMAGLDAAPPLTQGRQCSQNPAPFSFLYCLLISGPLALALQAPAAAAVGPSTHRLSVCMSL